MGTGRKSLDDMMAKIGAPAYKRDLLEAGLADFDLAESRALSTRTALLSWFITGTGALGAIATSRFHDLRSAATRDRIATELDMAPWLASAATQVFLVQHDWDKEIGRAHV